MTDLDNAWHIDPITLRDVIDDRAAFEEALVGADVVDRIWLLRILGSLDEAVEAGKQALHDAPDQRFRVLMLLAHAHQWRGELDQAKRLQDQASTLANTDHRRATVYQHVGKRLFDEGQYEKAASEFARALALRERDGASPDLCESSRMALDRTRDLIESVR